MHFIFNVIVWIEDVDNYLRTFLEKIGMKESIDSYCEKYKDTHIDQITPDSPICITLASTNSRFKDTLEYLMNEEYHQCIQLDKISNYRFICDVKRDNLQIIGTNPC